MKLPSSLSSALFLFLVAGTPVAATERCGVDPNTGDELVCQNGSKCLQEAPTLHEYNDHHLSNPPQGYTSHCECEPGWTGIECDIRVHDCSLDVDHYCLNGGQCVPGKEYCDCSSAVDEEGTRYVGKWCEHRERGHCGDATTSNEQFMFCLHGGTCNDDFPGGSERPCDCTPDYDGPHCEYHAMHNLPDCTLDCANGGVCKLGEGVGNDFEYNSFNSELDEGKPEDYMYCACPPGFHGEDCTITSEPCGDEGERCYHGGRCISEPGQETRCDCRHAGDDTTKYAGQFCQYAEEVRCTDPGSLHGHVFCVNGGWCLDDASDGCGCPPGFEGHACEYWVGENPAETQAGQDTQEEAKCELDCNGHGKCKNGEKDISGLGPAAHGQEYLNATSNIDFEHCVCDPGYVGLQCEHEVNICGDNQDFADRPEHFCLHGGECVKDDDEGYTCDCSDATSTELESTFFTGDHCQHPSESCDSVETDNTDSFCANGGTCVDRKEPDETVHPGCECVGGWMGDFCDEWPHVDVMPHVDGNDTSAPVAKDESDGKSAAAIVIAVLLLISFSTWGTVMACRYRKRRRYFKEAPTAYGDVSEQPKNLSPYTDSYTSSSSRDPMATFAGSSTDEEDPQVFVGPPQDEDGNHLENVNII